jgi:hypothetical protein
MDEARSAIDKLLELAPAMTISGLSARWPIRDTEVLNAILDGLRIAGLPE